MGLQRGRRAGEYAQMKEGVESTQHKCQTPTARGQAGGDLGVNHERRRGSSTGAAWRGPKKWDLTDFFLVLFCFPNESVVER